MNKMKLSDAQRMINASADSEWVPFTRISKDGTPITSGEKRVVSELTDDSHHVTAQFWRGEKGISEPFDFQTGDTVGVVLQGRVTVHLLDENETLDLEAGDSFTFLKGTNTRWQYHGTFMKYEVIIGSGPNPRLVG